MLLCYYADVLIGGDDFKSGQTKMKSVLVDFLVGAGIKPMSIVSYNHLGNNDGMNLSAPQTFRSKEISKSNVVSDEVIMSTHTYSLSRLLGVLRKANNTFLLPDPAAAALQQFHILAMACVFPFLFQHA